MVLYALTIFASAFLLFALQPIIAKLILPWFGGSAAVWATCILFFQAVLLLGYLYAHCSVRYLRSRLQMPVHIALLGLSILLLPIVPDAGWKPSGSEDPVLRILALLAVSVGMPYFMLSTTGPLLQSWYAGAYKVVFPYRLYAVSNLGSMLALLSYPVLIEPYVDSGLQSRLWSGGYLIAVMLCVLTAILSWRRYRPVELAESASGPHSAHIPLRTQAIWMLLAACPSVLLLATTNQLCQNVAAIPFLWVLPLSLYLLSFILCFERDGWYNRRVYRWLIGPALIGMCVLLLGQYSVHNVRLLVTLISAGLFLCCMFCHGELAMMKPHARNLTSFFLMISIGGAAGGFFVGMIAPHVFTSNLELPVGLAVCALLAMSQLYGRARPGFLLKGGIAIALGFCVSMYFFAGAGGTRRMARNFYGSVRVDDLGSSDGPDGMRVFFHGTINHGAQFRNAALKDRATAYYGPDSGVGMVLRNPRRTPQRVGVVGLGVGTLAAYGRAGDDYRFYEINPLVIQLARSEFSFLKNSAARIEVVLGDARLSLERERPQQFDVLVLDAFSGDSIPVHLLTREAFQCYMRHVQPEGILAVHISNRYLDLGPVVQRAADTFGKQAVLIESQGAFDQKTLPATWILLTANREYLDIPVLRTAGLRLRPRTGFRAWTDDYSNLFNILR
jgi:SAM-dependent methyltransferase